MEKSLESNSSRGRTQCLGESIVKAGLILLFLVSCGGARSKINVKTYQTNPSSWHHVPAGKQKTIEVGNLKIEVDKNTYDLDMYLEIISMPVPYKTVSNIKKYRSKSKIYPDGYRIQVNVPGDVKLDQLKLKKQIRITFVWIGDDNEGKEKFLAHTDLEHNVISIDEIDVGRDFRFESSFYQVAGYYAFIDSENKEGRDESLATSGNDPINSEQQSDDQKIVVSIEEDEEYNFENIPELFSIDGDAAGRTHFQSRALISLKIDGDYLGNTDLFVLRNDTKGLDILSAYGENLVSTEQYTYLPDYRRLDFYPFNDYNSPLVYGGNLLKLVVYSEQVTYLDSLEIMIEDFPIFSIGMGRFENDRQMQVEANYTFQGWINPMSQSEVASQVDKLHNGMENIINR